jgi:hypothetical protein
MRPIVPHAFPICVGFNERYNMGLHWGAYSLLHEEDGVLQFGLSFFSDALILFEPLGLVLGIDREEEDDSLYWLRNQRKKLKPCRECMLGKMAKQRTSSSNP